MNNIDEKWLLAFAITFIFYGINDFFNLNFKMNILTISGIIFILRGVLGLIFKPKPLKMNNKTKHFRGQSKLNKHNISVM